MSRKKLYIGLLLVFALGVLSGALGMGMYVKHKRDAFFEERRGKHLEFFMERLTRDLDLTQEQQVEVREILEEARDTFLDFRKKMMPEMKAMLAKHKERVRSILNEEQKAKFDEFDRRMMEMGPPGRDKLFFPGMRRPPRDGRPHGKPKPPFPPFPEDQ